MVSCIIRPGQEPAEVREHCGADGVGRSLLRKVANFLDQFQDRSPELLRYVGFLPNQSRNVYETDPA